MKFSSPTLSLSLVLLALAGCAAVGEVRTLGRYDFSYRIEGTAQAAPLQVFDDGRQTYFQFRQATPAIFGLDREGKPIVLTTRRDNQYVIAERIEREFLFLLEQDQVRASAKYIGTQNRTVLPHELAALRGHEPPKVESPPTGISSHRVPFAPASARVDETTRGALEALLPQVNGAKRVVILSRPAHERDRGIGARRAAGIREWLARRGVKRDRILIVKGIAIARDYCDVLFGAVEPVPTPGQVAMQPAPMSRAVLFGAARPIKVSVPAQPVFVDRGGFGITDAGMLLR